jgi:pimeloyl-ACP methyl ester carboxylesterase
MICLMPYARRDDSSLYYEREGSGEPPLLFFHGWCCDHTFFEPQFEHFKSSHTVVTVDLRGCGNSDRPGRGTTFRATPTILRGCATSARFRSRS